MQNFYRNNMIKALAIHQNQNRDMRKSHSRIAEKKKFLPLPINRAWEMFCAGYGNDRTSQRSGLQKRASFHFLSSFIE